MKKSCNFATADLMYGSKAYCNQWDKILIVFDDKDNARVIVSFDGSNYDVILIGDNKTEHFLIRGIELGSVGKNLKACNTLARVLHSETEFHPLFYKKKIFSVLDLLPGSSGAIRFHSFKAVRDENIAASVDAKIKAELIKYHYVIDSDDYEYIDCDYDDEEYDDGCWWDGYPSEEAFWECNGI